MSHKPTHQDFSHLAHYDFTTLQQLWIQAGGNPKYATFAAAVALAESGGNPKADPTNTNGSIDRGLWQINSIHGAQSSNDPMTNARAAISISGNGTNWKPWCTAWSDNACGTKGGSYLGKGSSAVAHFTAVDGGAIPQGTATTLAGLAVLPAVAAKGAVDAAFGGLSSEVKTVLRYALAALEAFAGAAVMGSGVVVLALILYRKNPELAAAVPGVGEAAGAAAAAKGVAQAKGDARRSAGADKVTGRQQRKTAAKETSPKELHQRAEDEGRTTTTGASRPGVETNPRPRSRTPRAARGSSAARFAGSGHQVSRQQAGSPF